MRTVRIGQDLLEQIERQAAGDYPDETCGFLFSGAEEAYATTRAVRSIEPVPNSFDGERRRRFVISPMELRVAEERAAGRSEVVSGFYHSHPDHPAVPSAFDAEHAWPWYTYLVVSVGARGPQGVGAFELEADRPRFRPCKLDVHPGAFVRVEEPAAARAGR